MGTIKFTSVKNDIYGNPRYVCHYANFLTEVDKDIQGVTNRYNLALSRSRRFGGKKFDNKQYGGGILFQEYCLESLEKRILKYLKQVELGEVK